MPAMKAAEPPGMTCRTDVSSHLNKSTVVGDFQECGNVISPTISDYTQFDIPYGRNKTLFYGRRNGEFNEQEDCAQARTNLSISFRPQDTYSFQHLDTLLASFITLNAQSEYRNGKSL
ncbi:hypothetical protein QQZ08_003746 [Neonectria magnoliae]|uniref:Uncharacterized protein n=1 Tax=Neonectria magnoliae TaxID=2732573 RepID=A0ABR1I848_9HYPO